MEKQQRHNNGNNNNHDDNNQHHQHHHQQQQQSKIPPKLVSQSHVGYPHLNGVSDMSRFRKSTTWKECATIQLSLEVLNPMCCVLQRPKGLMSCLDTHLMFSKSFSHSPTMLGRQYFQVNVLSLWCWKVAIDGMGDLTAAEMSDSWFKKGCCEYE